MTRDLRATARGRAKEWRTLAWSLDYEKDSARRWSLKKAALKAERIARGTKAMKVIFLDIDGVLNFWAPEDDLTKGIADMWTGRCLSPTCVEAFNSLVRDSGAQVVISSSWKDRPEYRGDLGALKRTLQDGGVGVEAIIGVTPNLGNRAAEILAWLMQHPEVTRFVVLDDTRGMSSLSEHLVLTQTSTGLTPDDALRADKILSGHQ